MTTISVINAEYFKILDDMTNDKFYGCNQKWYKKLWQRQAGCGPTVASNIILYSNKKIGTSKNESIELMEELWKHVTPTIKGVNTTNIFYNGLLSYARAMNLSLSYNALDIPMKKEIRPSFDKVVDFIKASLEKDIPLAFLNLCNGEEKCLDKWHWVTLISLEFNEDLSSAIIEILDEGMKKTIDLLLWYNTTTMGGGFVSFVYS